MSSKPIDIGIAKGAGAGLMAGPVGAAIGAGVGLFSDVTSYLLGQHSTKQQYKYNRRLMLEQNELNRLNFDYANAYNAPVEQRKRLAAAGLNPDLMYSNGAPLTTLPLGNPSSGSVSAAPVPSGGLINGALAATQLQSQQSQIELNKSTANLNNANADRIRQDTPNPHLTLTLVNSMLDKFGLRPTDPDVTKWSMRYATTADVNNVLNVVNSLKTWSDYQTSQAVLPAQKAQAALQEAVAKGQLQNSDVVQALIKMPLQQYNNLQGEYKKLFAEIGLIDKKGQLVDAQVATEKVRKLLLDSELSLNKAQLDSIEHSNIWNILNDLLHGEGDWKDKLIDVVAIGFMCLGGMNVKFNKTTRNDMRTTNVNNNIRTSNK